MNGSSKTYTQTQHTYYFRVSIIYNSVYYYFNEKKKSFENFDKAVIHVVFCLPLAITKGLRKLTL